MRVLEAHSYTDSIEDIEKVADYFDIIYLMGAFEPTEYSKELNSKYNLDPSLFSIKGYDYFALLFKEYVSHKIRYYMNKKLIIDFIPNHLGITERNYKYGFPDKRWGNWQWGDTIQLDYTKKETLEYMKESIELLLDYTDGFRFDMAHLLLQKNYNPKHNVNLGYEPLAELVKTARKVNPNCILIAETYQDYEDLRQIGFMTYRVEPRRNQMCKIEDNDIVIVDNHDESFLDSYNKHLDLALSNLMKYKNTLWYLPAIKGFSARPSANYYYNRDWGINNIIKEIYMETLNERKN